MSISAEVEQARRETADALSIVTAELDYITDELLEQIALAETVTQDEQPWTTEEGLRLTEGPRTEAVTCRPLTFGNSLVFKPGAVWYRQGNPGSTASFACGSIYLRRWGNRPGDQFNPLGRCSGGRTYYQLCRPAL